jgi:hypothetical protein
MADVEVTLDSNLESKLHKFPAVQASARASVVAIAERAKAMAPVQTGAYRDGIIVNAPNEKGVARVLSTDQKSSWVEFGTANQPGQFIIRSAAQSLGFKFVKKGG